MAAGDLVLSRLRRTMQSIFRIGNIQIKDSSGIVQAKNVADTAFLDIALNRLQVYGDNTSNPIIFDAPAGASATTYTLPSADGATGAFLQTNGSGTLSWSAASTNTDQTWYEAFTEATSSPVTVIATPDANTSILKIKIDVLTAAAASTPTVSVGTASDPDVYMDETDVDLLTTGTYVVDVGIELGGTPDPIILTITAAGQTFSGEVYVTLSKVA